MVALEDEADVLAIKFRALLAVHLVHGVVEEKEFAGPGVIQQLVCVADLLERPLIVAIRTDDGGQIAPLLVDLNVLGNIRGNGRVGHLSAQVIVVGLQLFQLLLSLFKRHGESSRGAMEWRSNRVSGPLLQDSNTPNR